MQDLLVQHGSATETLINDAPRKFTDADWPIGSVAHQGDVILVRIKRKPAGKVRQSRQVADGNTQGSRHILHGGKIFDCDKSAIATAIKIVCPKATVAEEYIGPVFTTDDNTALRHPEHGDHEYEVGMCVAVIYQRNLDSEERERRVRD